MLCREYLKEMFEKVHKKECYIKFSISLQFLQKKVWNLCSIKLGRLNVPQQGRALLSSTSQVTSNQKERGKKVLHHTPSYNLQFFIDSSIETGLDDSILVLNHYFVFCIKWSSLLKLIGMLCSGRFSYSEVLQESSTHST